MNKATTTLAKITNIIKVTNTFTVVSRWYEQYLQVNFLSPHADRYRLLFQSVCGSVFVRKIFCNGYLRHGLNQGDKICQDGRHGLVAGRFLFW